MPIETIILQLQFEEKDLIRIIPFLRRQISPWRWHFLPVVALSCTVVGLLFTLYNLATLSTYQYYIPGPNKIAQLVTVKETVLHAVLVPMTLVMAGLFYTVIVIRRTPLMVGRMIKNNPTILQPATLIISEEGIEEQGGGTETKYQWDFVKTVYEKLGGLIILFQSNSFLFISASKISEENYLKVKKIFSEKIGISEG